MEELISVIVPIYKVEKYLSKCVDSIINQTYKNIEIILVDDGSPDNCPKICDEYAEKDNRIKVIHKTNGGLSDARNVGIKAAQGEYITFVDSDDYIAPEMIMTLYERINQDKSEMAICNFLYVDEEMNDIFNMNQEMPIKNEKITGIEATMNLGKPQYQYYVVACCKLYHKDLFNNILFPVGKLHEDEFIAHKMFGKCNYVSCVEKPMYFYVQRKQSITSSEFSVKRLDGAEAFLQRCEYAMEHNLNELAVYSLSNVINLLNMGYANINLDDGEIKIKVQRLKKEYNSSFLKLLKRKISIKIKFLLTLFYLNPKLYRVFIQLNKLRKKLL